MIINEQSIKCNCMVSKIVKDVSDWLQDHIWRFKVHSSKLQIVNTHTMHLWNRNYLPSVAPEFTQLFLLASVLLDLFSVGIVCPWPSSIDLFWLPLESSNFSFYRGNFSMACVYPSIHNTLIFISLLHRRGCTK